MSLKIVDGGMYFILPCRDILVPRYGQDMPLEQFVTNDGFGIFSQNFSSTINSDEERQNISLSVKPSPQVAEH